VQEHFSRLLACAEFEVVICPELLLSEADAHAFDAQDACLAVVDGSDTIATLGFIRMLRLEQRNAQLLVLLPRLEDSVTSPLLRLGVKGLLTYEEARRELARAARQVAAGMYWVPRDLLTRFVESILPELRGCKSLECEVEISHRQRQVLDLLLDNLSNKEIASKLFVSERTVKFHVSNLLSKFGVRRRADLVVLWMQRTHAFPWLAHDAGRNASAHVN